MSTLEASTAAPGAIAPSLPRATGFTARVVRGSLWSLGGQGTTLLASLVATPIVIRMLGTDGYGMYSLVNVLIGYFAFADIGMGTASTRFAARAHARGDDKGEAAVVWTSLLIMSVPMLLAALALALSAPLIVGPLLEVPDHLHVPAVIVLQCAALGFLARGIANVLNTPQLARLRLDSYTLITSGCALAQTALVAIVLLLGAGLIGAVVTIVAAAIITAALHFVVSWRMLPALMPPRIDFALIRPLAGFGAALLVSAVAGTILATGDRLLVGWLGSVSAVGYYTVAHSLAALLLLGISAVCQPLLPAFSQLQRASDIPALQQLCDRATKGNLLWIAPVALLLLSVAQPFFAHWAGPEYGRESTLPFFVLLAGLAASSMAYVPLNLLVACGRSDLLARLYAAELIPYLVIAIPLIYWWGATGAALAWSLRVVVDALLMFVLAQRASGVAFSIERICSVHQVWALAVLLVPGLGIHILTASPVLHISVAILSAIAYGAIVWRRVLTSDERLWITERLKYRYHSMVGSG